MLPWRTCSEGGAYAMATMTATELRSRLYETLHRIHATGETIEVELKGERFLDQPGRTRGSVGLAGATSGSGGGFR